MVAGRRSIGIHEPDAWIFNRMADVYAARPAYPVAVVDAIAGAMPRPGCRVGDLGAGTGHLALPLAARGFEVLACEPAVAMLEQLRADAARLSLAVRAVQATAEGLPVADTFLDAAVIADAVHFVDAELTGRELRRVLARKAALAIVTVEPDDTPFMRAVVAAMQEAAPRKPRDVSQSVVQLFALSGVPLEQRTVFRDETPVDEPRLLDILRSISFIGPAMSPDRFAAFRERVLSLRGPRVWARTMTLHAGRRGRGAP